MKYPAYPKYKPSGVEWLGDVPEHWTVKQLKWAITLQRGHDLTTDERVEGVVPLVTSSGIAGTHNEARAKGPGIVTGRYGTIGEFYLVREDYWPINTTLYSIDLHGNDVAFLYYLLSHLSPLFLLNAVKSAVPGVDRNDLHPTPTVVPPIAEQRAIADFLDAQTTKLDTLLAKKRALIETLREQRTALISQTVTRGLPADAARAAGFAPQPKLKPSGIEWLGDVPEHWGTRRLRHISDEITVGVVINPSTYVTDEGVPFLLGGDIREFKISTANCNRCLPESSNGPLRKSRLSPGDIVVVRVGYPGVTAVIPPELDGANCASMMIVRQHPRFCSQWFAYAMNSQVGRDQIEIVQYGAAQKQFNISHAVDFSFPFPPLTEQRAIAAYLDRETARIDRMIETVAAAIERLQEYRTALITAAVTGRIDVRNVVASQETNQVCSDSV